MKKKILVLVALFLPLLLLAVIFNSSDETAATSLNQVSQLVAAQEQEEILVSERTDSMTACPPAEGGGSISPAISIYSIAFVVNGAEQVVYDGDTLEAIFGDRIEIKEAVICTGSFSGSGGEACVDLAPVDRSGQEILSEHAGTHMVPVISGFTTIPGPSHTWILSESWARFSVVLNHWTHEETEDVECANRRCEHDDWAIIELR